MVAETAEELQLLRDKLLIEEEAGLDDAAAGPGGSSATSLRTSPTTCSAPPTAPQEGHANPMLAAPLFALRAVEAGAVVRTHAEVTGLDVDPDGGTGTFT